MLKLQFSDHLHAPVWAMEKSFSIGKDDSNNLVLESESISPVHAKIVRRNNVFTLKDMGSKTGTFINNSRITQKNIVCGDTLRFGDVSLRVVDPLDQNSDGYWSLIADSSWLSGQEFPLTFQPNKPTLTIGRSKECDLIIAGTHLSKRHVRLKLLNKNRVSIEDLASTNGTFLNGKRITRAEARAGDCLRFDVYSFRLFGPGIDLPSSSITQTRMDAICDDALYDNTQHKQDKEKKYWKTRATCLGNREEAECKTRNLTATIVSLWMCVALATFIAYLAWALLQ